MLQALLLCCDNANAQRIVDRLLSSPPLEKPGRADRSGQVAAFPRTGRGIVRQRVVGSLFMALAAMLAAAGPGFRAMPASAAAGIEKADKVVVVKGERRLYLMRQGQVLKSYRIALGLKPKGTKLHQDDGRTPEGSYTLSGFNPGSRFHRAIRVSYPNAQDRARAEALGVAPGGDIMLHGLAPERRQYGAAHWQFNWTDGCIAVTDREIEEIWQRVEIGTPIEIRP